MVRFQATGVGDLGDESGASSLPTGPEFTAPPPDGVVPWIRAPLPFPAPGLSLSCVCCEMQSWLAVAQSWWSTVWLGWRAVRLGHRAGWAGAQSWLGCWLGWGTGLVGLEQWSTELVRLEQKAG